MLRPYLGRIDGKIKWGKRIRLAPYDAPLSQIWKAYEELAQPKAHTISWLLSLYFSSPYSNIILASNYAVIAAY